MQEENESTTSFILLSTGLSAKIELTENKSGMPVKMSLIVSEAGEDSVFSYVGTGEYRYDEAGRVISLDTLMWNHEGPQQINVTASYDEEGRLTERTEENYYDGLLLNGSTCRYEYDSKGNLVREATESFDSHDEKSKTVNLYEHDKAGRVTQRTLLSYYDGTTLSDKTVYQCRYNENGQLTYKAALYYSAEGNSLSGKDITEHLYNGTRLVKTSTYSTDAYGEKTDGIDVIEYSYNGNDVLVKEKLTHSSDGITFVTRYETIYTYNIYGMLAQEEKLDYDYLDGKLSFSYFTVYDLYANMTSYKIVRINSDGSYATPSETVMTYNEKGDPLCIRHKDGDTVTSESKYEYARYGLNTLAEYTERDHDGVVVPLWKDEFSYNDMGLCTEYRYIPYDENGERAGMETVTCTFAENGFLLSRIDASYNADGDVIEKETRTFEYDAEGRFSCSTFAEGTNSVPSEKTVKIAEYDENGMPSKGTLVLYENGTPTSKEVNTIHYNADCLPIKIVYEKYDANDTLVEKEVRERTADGSWETTSAMSS